MPKKPREEHDKGGDEARVLAADHRAELEKGFQLEKILPGHVGEPRHQGGPQTGAAHLIHRGLGVDGMREKGRVGEG